jgi:transposase
MVGIDVGKASVVACLLKQDGRELVDEFPNTPTGHYRLHRWIVKAGGSTGVCMESTGCYHLTLARYLHDQQYQVSVVNPRRIKAYGESRLRRGKNDQVDARLIAQFAQGEPLPIWQPPSEAQVALRAIQDRLDELDQTLGAQRNRREHCAEPAVLASLDREAAFLKAEQARLTTERTALLAEQTSLGQAVRLLQTIPGVGQLTAVRLVARVDITQFDQAGSFAAYLGLTPREHSSGTSVHKRPRLSKLGSKRLRTALYFPALRATRDNPQIQALYQRLLAKGKPKPVALGAAMRKLAGQIYGVWSSGRPYEPTLGLPASTPLAA